MYCIKDVILKGIGFEWVHLFATYFSLNDGSNLQVDFEGIDNIQLLSSSLPAMIATLPEILDSQIVPAIFGSSNARGS